jgi:DNA-binding MarR family transcriptional regulator
MSIFSELGVRDGSDRRNEEFLYNLAACYAAAERRIAAVLSKYGLSPVQMNALLMICHANAGKGLSQNELSRRLIVSAGNVTRLVDRLERDGYVARSADAEDRRVKCARITGKGRRAIETAWPAYKNEVERLVRLLPDAKVREATQTMDAWRRKISNGGAIA